MKTGFSIVFVTHNCRSSVNTSFARLVNLSIKLKEKCDVEIIVCDDCSSDETLSYLRKYCASKLPNIDVSFVTTSKNFGGPARPRNLALSYAKFKWLIFFDAGDYAINDSIVNYYLFGARSDCHLLAFSRTSNLDPIAATSTVFTDLDVNYHLQNKIRKISFYEILFNNPITLSGVLISRDFLRKQKLIFNEEKEAIGVEDYSLWISMASIKNFRGAIVSDELIFYNRSPAGLSSEIKRRLMSHWYVLRHKYGIVKGSAYFIIRASIGAYKRIFE